LTSAIDDSTPSSVSQMEIKGKNLANSRNPRQKTATPQAKIPHYPRRCVGKAREGHSGILERGNDDVEPLQPHARGDPDRNDENSDLWVFDAGIDAFGPTHWFEMALPVLVLTMLGCRRATGWAEKVSPRNVALPRNLLLAFVAGSLLLFSPYRLRAVGEIGAMTLRVPDAIDRNDIYNAVVFVNRQWAAKCIPDLENPPRHFVFWWPVNDPDFENDVIWANLSIGRAGSVHAAGTAPWDAISSC